MEVALAVRALHLLELRIAAYEVEPVLQVRADSAEPARHDQPDVNILLPMCEIQLDRLLCVDGEVGLALFEIGVELKIQLLALLDGRCPVARPEAAPGILAFLAQPQTELPVVAPLVDDGLVKNDDFILIKVLLFDDHASLPEPLRKRVAAKMCSFPCNIARASVEKQWGFCGVKLSCKYFR